MSYIPTIPKRTDDPNFGHKVEESIRYLAQQINDFQAMAKRGDFSSIGGKGAEERGELDEGLKRQIGQIPYITKGSSPSLNDPQRQEGSLNFESKDTKQLERYDDSTQSWEKISAPADQETTGAYILLPLPTSPPTAADVTVGSNNQVRVCRIYIPCRIPATRLSANLSTLSAGGLGDIGLYSSDGNTKLISLGATATDATGIKSATFSAVYVGPGFYYIAWTFDNTTATWRGQDAASTVDSILNDSTVHKGTAANPSVAGVLPSALGTITAVSFGLPFIKIQS